MVTIKLKGQYASSSNGSGAPAPTSSAAAAMPASPSRLQQQLAAVGPLSFYSSGLASPSGSQSGAEAGLQASLLSEDAEDNQQARGAKRRKMQQDDDVNDGAGEGGHPGGSPSRLGGSKIIDNVDDIDNSVASQEARDLDNDIPMEQDDGEDDDYAQSSSSQDDVDYVNAPLPLPDSSGDEYAEPGIPSKFTRRAAAKGRASARTRSRRRNTDDRDEDDQPAEAEIPSQRRGRPASRRIMSESLEPAEEEQPPVEKCRSIKLTLKTSSKPSVYDTAAPENVQLPPVSKAEQDADDGGDYAVENANDDDESQMGGDDDDDDGGTSTRDSRGGSSAVEPIARSSSKSSSKTKKKSSAPSGGATSNRAKAVDGKRFPIVRDQLMLPEDAAGETKIDHLGRLQGGREYKAFTFRFPTRAEPERLYVLSIDAARATGFRDSLYFFRRNPWMHKINCTSEEKDMLIALGRLHVNLKSRQVVMVTARNCFQVFGARFVKNGKYILDDYYESAALAKGFQSGAPAWSEVYNPEIDNTTLAMPKIGNFAQKAGPGRPAYMKIGQAMDMAGANRNTTTQEDDDDDLTVEERRKKEEVADVMAIAEEEKRAALAAKKGTHSLLGMPASYHPAQFGLIPLSGAAGVSLGPGVQFGGNGLPPFNEQWEKSKARKPAPHMNGRNWMWFWARAVMETNKAVIRIRREYSASHRIVLGATDESAMDEAEAGVWRVSDDEADYETLDEFRSREGVEGAAGQHFDDEPDDRHRGRTPEPASLILVHKETATTKLYQSPQTNCEPREKKRRRRRSPLRGFFDSHTRSPIVRSDTQSTQILRSDRLASYAAFDEESLKKISDRFNMDSVKVVAAEQHLATVEFALHYQAN